MPEKINPEERVKIELATALRNQLENWQVKNVLVDIDGTLTDTTTHYRTGMERSLSRLLFGIDLNQITDQEKISTIKDKNRLFVDRIKENHAKYHVHPLVVFTSLHEIAENVFQDDFQDNPQYLMACEEIDQIYNGDCPLPLPYAREMVKVFKLAGYNPIAATHADKKWTERKITAGKLEINEIIAFNTRLSKQEQWLDKVLSRDIQPENSLIIGDNPDADFSLADHGAYGVWINNKNKKLPDYLKPYHQSGKLIIVSQTAQVISAIIGYH